MKKTFILIALILSFSAGTLFGKSYTIDDFMKTVLRQGATVQELNQFYWASNTEEFSAAEKMCKKSKEECTSLFRGIQRNPQEYSSALFRMIQDKAQSDRYIVKSKNIIEYYVIEVGNVKLGVKHYVNGPLHDIFGPFYIEYINNKLITEMLGLTADP